VFAAIGGFDEEQFPRPSIEDIELGYRLRDAGFTIRLCKEVRLDASDARPWPARHGVESPMVTAGKRCFGMARGGWSTDLPRETDRDLVDRLIGIRVAGFESEAVRVLRSPAWGHIHYESYTATLVLLLVCLLGLYRWGRGIRSVS
jgi:hypothetical protein